MVQIMNRRGNFLEMPLTSTASKSKRKRESPVQKWRRPANLLISNQICSKKASPTKTVCDERKHACWTPLSDPPVSEPFLAQSQLLSIKRQEPSVDRRCHRLKCPLLSAEHQCPQTITQYGRLYRLA
jgi:hypothetical protein